VVSESLSIVRVEWVDSTNIVRWNTKADLTACLPKHCASVGFLLHETDDAIWIVQSDDRDSDDEDRNFNNTMVIPKIAITKREVIG